MLFESDQIEDLALFRMAAQILHSVLSALVAVVTMLEVFVHCMSYYIKCCRLQRLNGDITAHIVV